jgi:hypothetical protein
MGDVDRAVILSNRTLGGQILPIPVCAGFRQMSGGGNQRGTQQTTNSTSLAGGDTGGGGVPGNDGQDRNPRELLDVG